MTTPFRDDSFATIHRLSGAPASILIALFFAARPVGRNELTTALTYGKDKIAEGLQILEALGLVHNIKRYNGWTLTRRVQQLFLPGMTPEITAGKSAQSTSPTTTTVLNNIDSDNKVVVIAGKSAQSTSTEIIEDEPPEETPLYQELRRARIGDPSRSQLATIEHLTPAIVKAWKKHLRKRYGNRYQPGLLITALKSVEPEDPPPDVEPDLQKDRQNYSDWEN